LFPSRAWTVRLPCRHAAAAARIVLRSLRRLLALMRLLLHPIAALAGRALPALLLGAPILIGRSLLRLLLHLAAALAARRRLALATLLSAGRLLLGALASGGRLAGTALSALLDVDAERTDRTLVDLPGRLQALLPLERDQRLPGAQAEHAIGLADIEPLLIQHDLHLPDLLHAQRDRCATATAALERCAAGRSHRHHRDHLARAVDDDDLVTHDEELVSAPFGMNLDQRHVHRDDTHVARHNRTDAKREVDVIDARHVGAGQHSLLDPGALLGAQGHPASLALLSLTLLSLALLALLALLTLLGRLTLLPLRSLSLSLVALPALGLGRALALITLALASGLIPVTLTALLGLILLAFPLLVLALRTLALLALLALALLALFFLSRWRLAGGLIPLALSLAALGLTLLALVLALLLLRLPAALRRLLTLLCARARLGCTAGLSAGAGLCAASGLSAAGHRLR
jgi:hypothetical protein